MKKLTTKEDISNLLSASTSAIALGAAIETGLIQMLAKKPMSGEEVSQAMNIPGKRGDSVLLDRAYGLADPELAVPSSTTGRYRIASLTKTFTAAAIAMLAERGSLRLEDTLSRFLPDFPGADAITILHLLRHEAGLDNPDYRDAMRERIDLAELVRRAGNRLIVMPGAGIHDGNIRELIAPKDRDRVAKYGRDRMAGKPTPEVYEFEGVRKNGSRIWVLHPA